MSKHFHAIVWIDHREARIFHFNASEADTQVLHPDNPKVHLHHKANTIGSGHAAEDKAYFHRVAEAIQDAGAILVTGPANAKTELVKHIEAHHPALRAKIVGVEPLDHLTSGQLLAYAREKFSRDHQMPPRTKQG